MERGTFDQRLALGERRRTKERKLSPYLVPWLKLIDAVQDYDRAAVRAWPRILAQAGLVIKRP